MDQNSTQSRSAYQVPNVEHQVVDSAYIGVVVGTVTSLVIVFILLVILVLLRRRICKPLSACPPPVCNQ